MSERPIRDSGKMTITRLISKVANAASVGLLGMRISSLRCRGAKTMANTTPQKMATAYSSRTKPNPAVTAIKRRMNARL